MHAHDMEASYGFTAQDLKLRKRADRMTTEAAIIAKALELLRRDLGARPVMSGPTAVRDYLRLSLAPLEHEAFAVMFLDSQHRVIEVEVMFRGTLTQTSVYPREVVKAALGHGAGAVILSHNHPSGSLSPSVADEALTHTLKAALALVDVRVLDHVIVTREGSLSMAERGLI